MDKPHKKFRIVGERRPELDVARFADALITLAMHRVEASTADTNQHDDQTSAAEGRSS